MTNQQKDQISALRSQGFGYATIAKAVGLKKDTVVAYCRKIGLTGTKATDNSRIDLDADFCLQCGALLTQTPGRKRIKFCSDKCRVAWWNSHPEKVNRKAVYDFTCAHCGKPFTAYGNAGRKFTISIFERTQQKKLRIYILDPVKNKSNFLQKVGFISSFNLAKIGTNPTANPTGFFGCFILTQKVEKTPDFLSKSGVFMVAEAGLEPTTSGL